MRLSRLSFLLLILLFFFPHSLLAVSLPEDLLRDFKPLTGLVIGHDGNDLLLDLGSEQGVQEGDLFSVIAPGAKVVHPQTGEVLGQKLEVKALLQVIWVQPKFSQARLFSGQGPIADFARVGRYERLKASFIDATGTGENLYLELREAFPQFLWLGYGATAAQAAPPAAGELQLQFILEPTGLEVRGPDQRLLHQYPAEGMAAMPSAATAKKPLSAPAEPMATPATGFRELASLPLRATATSFIRQGDRLLLAASEGQGFQVLTVSEQPTVLAEGSLPLPGKILGLNWWQPSAKDPLHLAATQVVEANEPGLNPGQRIDSTLFRLEQNRLVRIQTGISALLGSFDLDGNGSPETLLGQNFDRDVVFGGRIEEFRLHSGELAREKCSLPLPQGFPVIGGTLRQPADSSGGLTSAWVRKQTLFIADEGKVRYQAPNDMGGSLVSMTYDVNPDSANRMFRKEALEVPPLLVDHTGPDMIAIASEGGLLRMVGAASSIQESWLVKFSEQNGRFERRLFSPRIDAAIQGLSWDRDRLLLVATSVNDDSPSRILVLAPGP